MFGEADLEGAGIALDEFNDDGLLNIKRFHDSITLAAFSVDDSSSLGGVILGSSSMTATESHIYICLYIVAMLMHGIEDADMVQLFISSVRSWDNHGGLNIF